VARIITLRYPGRCADCDATLHPGDIANWVGRGIVFGLHCHAEESDEDFAVTLPVGRCIDAPCCGCCDDGTGIIDYLGELIA